MLRTLKNGFLFGCLLSLLLPADLFAQDEHKYELELDVGYRWEALFRGSRDLYRTQLDLGEGPKLFAGELYFAPAEGSTELLDRLQLQFNNWGGEPYNTFRIQLAKNGVYELDFNYQNIAYFSSIPSFANPKFESGNLLSQHREDTSLRTASLDLRFRPGKMISPFVGYQRTTRQGPVFTTLGADGDEFQLNKDLEFSHDDLRGGVIFQAQDFTLLLQQGARWYRDQSTFLASGPLEGNSTRPFLGRDIFLDQYEATQDVKSRAIPYSSASATYRPFPQLLLSGDISYSMADFRTSFFEDLSGNFFSFPALRAFYGGLENSTSGTVKKPNLLADVSATWEPLDWLRVVERFRTHRFHISGHRLARLTFFDVDPLLGTRILDELEQESILNTFLGQDVDRQQLEAHFLVHPKLTLRVGHRYETRTFELDPQSLIGPGNESPGFGDLASFGWDRNVLLLGGTYRISARNRLSLEYELGRTDQPIFRTDVKDFQRLKIRGVVSPAENLQFSGRVSLFDHDDDIVQFDSENRGYGLQFSYQPISRVSVVGQWEQTEINTSIPYLIPQSLQPDLFTFREFANYGNLYLDFLLMRNSRLSVGYSVWGNSGDFPVNYHRPMARLEVPLAERFTGYVQWNYYDYNEKLRLFPQDYRSHLVTFGFRVSMGNM